MSTDVIVLNGTSSSGKTSLARHLLELLEGPWVTLGVDVLLGALAPSLATGGQRLRSRGRSTRCSIHTFASTYWPTPPAVWPIR